MRFLVVAAVVLLPCVATARAVVACAQALAATAQV